MPKNFPYGIEQEISPEESKYGIVKKVFNQGKKGRIIVWGDSFSISIASFLHPVCELENHILYRKMERPVLDKILKMKPDCVIAVFWIPTILEMEKADLLDCTVKTPHSLGENSLSVE